MNREDIEIVDDVIIYYGNPAGIIKEDRVVIDTIFARKELETFIEKNIGRMIAVTDGVYEKLISGKGIDDKEKNLTYVIYQLKKDTPYEMRFISLEERERRGYGIPKKSEYDLVYKGSASADDIESIWEIFEVEMPKGYEGRCITVSDVIEISDGNEIQSFYLEQFGTRKINFI